MTTYKYIGNGAGVPGLPHEVSDEEAKEAGVEELLKDAISAGVYVEVKAAVLETRVSDAADSALKVSRPKGVNNG